MNESLIKTRFHMSSGISRYLISVPVVKSKIASFCCASKFTSSRLYCSSIFSRDSLPAWKDSVEIFTQVSCRGIHSAADDVAIVTG